MQLKIRKLIRFGSEGTSATAEDDELVRSVVHIALAGRGYRLIEAKDGLEALAAAERFEGPIHLLVSDVNMPRMDGSELAGRLLARRPELRVLLITGFAADDVMKTVPRGPRVDVLEKPFTPDQLAARVRATLDRTV